MVAGKGYTDNMTKGVIWGIAGAILCFNFQYIVTQWEALIQCPLLFCAFIMSVGFTGINYAADCVVLVLVFMASLRTILFWIRHTWYLQHISAIDIYIIFSIFALVLENNRPYMNE